MGRMLIELLQEGGHDLARATVAGALQDKVFSTNELTTAEEEGQGACFIVTTSQFDHILIVLPYCIDDALLLQYALNRLDAVTNACGLFKVQFLGCLFHLLLESLEYFVVFSFEEEDDLLNDGIIFLARGIGNTWSDTAMNVILCTGPRQQLLFPTSGWFISAWWCPTGCVVATGAKCKQFVEQIKRGIDCARIGIRTKVTIPVALKTTYPIHTRKIFSECNFDIRVILIIT